MVPCISAAERGPLGKLHRPQYDAHAEAWDVEIDLEVPEKEFRCDIPLPRALSAVALPPIILCRAWFDAKSVIRLSREAWALMQAEAAGHKKHSSGGVMCSQKLGGCSITEPRQVSRH